MHIKTAGSSKPLKSHRESLVSELTLCRWYYGDERRADGAPIFKVNGDAHAKLYWELAEAKTQGPWMQTFVKDVGYKNFEK